jgi:hypothetical protein
MLMFIKPNKEDRAELEQVFGAEKLFNDIAFGPVEWYWYALAQHVVLSILHIFALPRMGGLEEKYPASYKSI